MHKWTNPFFSCFNKRDKSSAILITCENISCAMVISNFYQKPCFTCLSGADPHGFHCFTEIGQIFHNRCIKLQGFIRGEGTGQIILSEWLRNPKWDFGMLKSKKISHWDIPPDPPKACAFGARLGNRSVLILDPRLLRVFVLVSL